MQIEVFRQSALKMQGEKVIYFDPFKIEDEYHDADYIFITHDHYDHYDEESLKKIMKEDTRIIVPKVLKERVEKLTTNYLVVEPNNEYKYDNITFKTVPSYNINKTYHPKAMGYVGYILTINNITYYIMGDTDALDENKNIRVDYCFVPIGGTYTMNVEEASSYINTIKPKVAIPIHYGSIVGDISLKDKFKKLVNKDIEVNIYIGEEK